MTHELNNPIKKRSKTYESRNSKTNNSKNFFDYSSFESSYYDKKNNELSSATFIPSWLKNSLGLNQKNLLSYAASNSNQKSSKTIPKDKEISHNEYDSLRRNTEHNSCKGWKDQNDLVIKDYPQETIIDHAEPIPNGERIREYRNLKSNELEIEGKDTKLFGKGDWVKLDPNVIVSEDIKKLKEEDIRKIKLINQNNKLKKHVSSDVKNLNLNKSDVDFLLNMKAREVVENFKKKDVHSISPELRNVETNIMLLGKPHTLNSEKIKEQHIRLLKEMKNRMVSAEDFKRFMEHLKEINFRDIVKNSEFMSDIIDRKYDEKEDKREKKSAREISQKRELDERLERNKDCLLSTDDEDNIKRFSQFLSKNNSLEEKKKCLNEVRNYFEKKRKSRLTRRHFLEDEKKKLNVKTEKKEENIKDKLKIDTSSKGMKSKFGICDDDMVKKAVEDTLHKFTDLYHINVTPKIVENMKKNIINCISNYPKNTSSSLINRKIYMDQSAVDTEEPEKMGSSSFLQKAESSSNEPAHFKENKKFNLKTIVSLEEPNDSIEVNEEENDKFKRLKKEFDTFLNSVLFHMDYTNLKLQRVIFEREEEPPSSKNVHFVYNFTKKLLEEEEAEVVETKSCNDGGTQTEKTECEMFRRNVKVQAFEDKNICEQNLQTEKINASTEGTQTNSDHISFLELKELKNFNVIPGLYRMIKSKEPGKFYLYPERLDEGKQSKKIHRKKEIVNVASKSSSKARRFSFKESEKHKVKKIKNIGRTFVRFEGAARNQSKKRISKGDSVNCLYFKNLDRSYSELFSSKKELRFGKSTAVTTDNSDELILEKTRIDNLGYFWFWNGEKIAPGCDLKKHVENLLKEKLTEIMGSPTQSKELTFKSMDESKNEMEICRKNSTLGSSDFVDNTTLSINDERNKTEEKKIESEEIEEVLSPEEKPVRNIAIHNSMKLGSSKNISKLKVNSSKIRFPVKKKSKRGSLILKNHRGKPLSIRKAENIVEAIEELKRLKFEEENSKEGLRDSESFLNFSLSMKESANDCDQYPMIYRRQESLETVDSSIKNKLKKLVSLVNCELQRKEAFDADDVNSAQNLQLEDQKHFELIETVLNRITHKERESLWYDVRDFIKTRINKDVNDGIDQEVCIEIEQDLHKNDQGKLRDILAKGHYRRHEGDIEVEIDLTLDDLERILRRRQKMRRRNLYRSSGSKKFLSSSSIQSELTREELRRYQKYFQNLASERDCARI